LTPFDRAKENAHALDSTGDRGGAGAARLSTIPRVAQSSARIRVLRNTALSDGAATDPAIGAFLRAPDAATARRELEGLVVGVARPIVHAIVRGTFRSGLSGSVHIDADDVEQTVLTNLIASLMRLRSSDPPAPIRSLPDYAAVIAYNTCHAVLRLRAPERARLRAHVRYVLTHHAELTLIETSGHRWLASLTSWAADRSPAPPDAIDSALARVGRPPGWPRLSGPALAQLLEATLREIDGPCVVELLVGGLASAFGGIDMERVPDHQPEPAIHPPSPVERLDYRERLESLWREINALPPRQRIALLLNLRDENGAGVIELLPATGVATMPEIARAIGLPEAELAQLWPTLPRDDQWIAERLGLTRRQVINLRKCARERLFRRSRAPDGSTAPSFHSVHAEGSR
jgi:DNA-directed RNA polymerase specialized sigma24 family protein